MTFQEMQTRWDELDRKLDAAVLATTRFHALQTVRPATQMQRFWIVFDILIHGIALAALGVFIVRHATELPLLVSALSLHIFVIVRLGSSVRQYTALSDIEWSATVTDALRRIENVRRLRILTNKWSLILAPLMWTSLLAVALEAAFGINAYEVFPASWLAANFLFGLVFLVAMIWVSKRYGERLRGSWLRKLVDDFDGRSLARTSQFLQEIAAFERDID
jgi:hypothetical protein